MIKKYAIQMSYEISDIEKAQAEKAMIHFKASIKLLDLASEHLNIMGTPFKENPEMDAKSVMEARAAIRRFRDQSSDNFNEFKSEAFRSIKLMEMFSADTQTIKLIKSFISSVDTLEGKVNAFIDIFNDLEDKEFSKNVVEKIEDIQKECKEVEEIIDDRIMKHLQTNILAKSWVDTTSKNLQIAVEKKTPLLIDLYNKRQEQLQEAIKQK